MTLYWHTRQGRGGMGVAPSPPPFSGHFTINNIPSPHIRDQGDQFVYVIMFTVFE